MPKEPKISLPPDPMPTVKLHIKNRIDAQGLTKEWIQIREGIKRFNPELPVAEAWRQAAIEVEEKAEKSDGDVTELRIQSKDRDTVEYRVLPDIPIQYLEEINRGQPNKSKAIQWVTTHLYVDSLTFDHLIQELDAPTAALAWTFLKYAKREESTEQDFLKSIAPRVLMGRADLEKEDRFEDDGRDIISIIDRIERIRSNAILPSSTQDR